jgi:hypothetical protein
MPSHKPPPVPNNNNEGKDFKRTMSMMSMAQKYQKEKPRERRTSVDLTTNVTASPLFNSEPISTSQPISSAPLPDKETIQLVQSGGNIII